MNGEFAVHPSISGLILLASQVSWLTFSKVRFADFFETPSSGIRLRGGNTMLILGAYIFFTLMNNIYILYSEHFWGTVFVCNVLLIYLHLQHEYPVGLGL